MPAMMKVVRKEWSLDMRRGAEDVEWSFSWYNGSGDLLPYFLSDNAAFSSILKNCYCCLLCMMIDDNVCTLGIG